MVESKLVKDRTATAVFFLDIYYSSYIGIISYDIISFILYYFVIVVYSGVYIYIYMCSSTLGTSGVCSMDLLGMIENPVPTRAEVSDLMSLVFNCNGRKDEKSEVHTQIIILLYNVEYDTYII